MKKPWYDFLYVRSPLAKLGFALLGVLGAIAILVWWGAAVEDKRMVAQTANWEGRSIEKGAELYMNNCASCHGIDGKGAAGVAPALHSRYFFQQRLTDVGFAGTLRDYVKLTVAAGRPSIKKSQWITMPTWSSASAAPCVTIRLSTSPTLCSTGKAMPSPRARRRIRIHGSTSRIRRLLLWMALQRR